MAQFGHHLKQHRAIMCPTFVRQMDRVANYSAAELYDAIFQRTRHYRQVQSWFDTCDIVAMPTLSRNAVPIDQDFFGPAGLERDCQYFRKHRSLNPDRQGLRMIFETICPADIAPERVNGLVPRHVHHLEDRCPMLGCRTDGFGSGSPEQSAGRAANPL